MPVNRADSHTSGARFVRRRGYHDCISLLFIFGLQDTISDQIRRLSFALVLVSEKYWLTQQEIFLLAEPNSSELE
jgi:hypothetical protein